MSTPPHELPASLDAPTIRALTGAGYTTLPDLARATEAEILALHGIGPRVVAKLKDLMATEGVSFAGGAPSSVRRSAATPADLLSDLTLPPIVPGPLRGPTAGRPEGATLTGLDDLRRFVSVLPEVTEKPHFGRPAFRVRDKLFLSVHLEEERPFVIAHVSQETAAAEVAALPDVVEQVWRTHSGKRIFVGLRVDLAAASAEHVSDLAELAWRHRAPKRLVAAHDDT